MEGECIYSVHGVSRIRKNGKTTLEKNSTIRKFRTVQNVFKERELAKNSVCRKFQHTARDGKAYSVNFYNLDVAEAYSITASGGKN